MANCESAIWEYLKQIEPTSTQKDGAKRSHKYLRDILCTGQFSSRIKTSYLSGSYARDTAIAPLDDVDIIFVVNPEFWATGFFALKPSPSAILESFARAVRYRYPKSSVRVQRRSICLHLHHLDIDVVPAIEADGAGNTIWVPDSRTGNWIKSAPKLHSSTATEINKSHAGRFKPLVKLLKCWNYNLPSTARLKSFAIETMAARLFNSIKLPSLQEGLALYFDFVASLAEESQLYRWSDTYEMSLSTLAPKVPDLANTGSNLVANLEIARRNKFIDHAIRSRDRMSEAKAAIQAETACKRVYAALRLT